MAALNRRNATGFEDAPMDPLDDFMTSRPPTARRPLLGVTVLVVEDSRFACEALRLLCLRSGARIRRADTLEHARKHLGVYRPTVLIVDVGLPDGSGLDLITTCAKAIPRIDVILGTSGDSTLQEPVLASGANGYLAKPISNLAAFQSAILTHLPSNRQPPGPRLVTDESVNPDLIAYQDDLTHMAAVIRSNEARESLGYVTQFLQGIAQSVKDSDLGNAASAVADKYRQGTSTEADLIALGAMVNSRLETNRPL